MQSSGPAVASYASCKQKETEGLHITDCHIQFKKKLMWSSICKDIEVLFHLPNYFFKSVVFNFQLLEIVIHFPKIEVVGVFVGLASTCVELLHKQQ